MAKQDSILSSRIGPVEVDWPRSVGYFGGIAVAVAVGILEPPVGVFIAAIPFIKMLNHPKAPVPARAVAQVLGGAAKPVGGDGQATIELKPEDQPPDEESSGEQSSGAKRNDAQ